MCPGNHNCLGSLADCQMRVTLMLKPPSSITLLQEGVKGTLSLPLRPPGPLPPVLHKSLSWDFSFPHLLLGVWSRVGVPGIFHVREMEPEVEQSRRENTKGRKF